MAEWLRAWDTLVMMKAGGRELDPRPGHYYSRMSPVFSSECAFFQNYQFIWNIVPVAKQ